MKVYSVGLKFDTYSTDVEANITRDLLTLQAEAAKDRTVLQVVCDDASVDRLLKALGILRISLTSVAELWIVYQTGDRPVDVPENAKKVVTRRLGLAPAANDNKLRLDLKNSGPVLKEFGRENYHRPFERQAPANHDQITVDPTVAILFG